jgi:outer membrane protein OmpA-like peptidoglycan-associated protein
MEALLGVRAPVGPVELYAMGGPGFGTTVGTPAVRVLAGVAFAPEDKPVCVEGQSYPVALCPELDADGDGVKNRADQCPRDAGLEQLGGCPDKDDDGDGLPNLVDRCPRQAENVNGFEDGDGCPDEPDSDGDGITDSKDRCPQQAEDKDGFQDEDGCPDPDNDGDGVADARDACPNEAGVAANKGCPDKDRDGDSIVDRLDNCPDEPGTQENNGCKQKQRVRLETGRLDILESIYFEVNEDVIDRRSYKLLDDVVSILREHPEIERMRVEGHSDNQGDAQYNTELSQRRAESVVKHLEGKGIPRERLQAKGFGPAKPLADNTTKDGRAKNRRVEFHIVGDAEGVETQQGAPNSNTAR